MMVKIRLKIFVYLIVIGNGVIVKSSSPEKEHNPPVSEDVKESEEILTSFSPLTTSSSSSSSSSTSTTTSVEKPSDEPAISSSKEQSLKILGENEEFNPSVYLGEIKGIESQSRISTSVPFNNVQHVRFEGSIGLEGDTGVIYRQHYPYHNNNDDDYHHHHHHHYNTDHRQEDSHSPSSYAEGYLTVEVPTKPVYYTSEEPNHYVNVEILPHQSLETIQPHQYPQHSPTKYEFEPINYHHYSSQVGPIPRPEVTLTKPETLLYLSSHRQTSLMKTRKFPYKYYQPNDDIPLHFYEQGHAFPTQHIRVSPWKKLIHLIGAFLPIGLLLAALRPNVKAEPSNTTQPNIVLSKWRGIELPVEHKEDVDEDKCEDRSLCEIILVGAQVNAGLIHSILWNFAIKSTDQEAHRNGLDEIFNGVRKKDCNLIRC